MPPKNASMNTAQRKGPQFNLPRPVKAPVKPSTASERAPQPAARSKATAIDLSSGEEEENEDEKREEDSDHLMEFDGAPALPPVPTALLGRLLQENFEDPNTRIHRTAMTLTEKYIEIFVMEAFARAKHERQQAVKAGSISDGFLQVEDLERLAPQLVLDF